MKAQMTRGRAARKIIKAVKAIGQHGVMPRSKYGANGCPWASCPGRHMRLAIWRHITAPIPARWQGRVRPVQIRSRPLANLWLASGLTTRPPCWAVNKSNGCTANLRATQRAGQSRVSARMWDIITRRKTRWNGSRPMQTNAPYLMSSAELPPPPSACQAIWTIGAATPKRARGCYLRRSEPAPT